MNERVCDTGADGKISGFICLPCGYGSASLDAAMRGCYATETEDAMMKGLLREGSVTAWQMMGREDGFLIGREWNRGNRKSCK
jgi:hypothetical protein